MREEGEEEGEKKQAASETPLQNEVCPECEGRSETDTEGGHSGEYVVAGEPGLGPVEVEGGSEHELGEDCIRDIAGVVEDATDFSLEDIAAKANPGGGRSGGHQDHRIQHHQDELSRPPIFGHRLHRLILGRAAGKVNRSDCSAVCLREESLRQIWVLGERGCRLVTEDDPRYHVARGKTWRFN